MIHSMQDCRLKLEAIKAIAHQGIKDSRDVMEMSKFEQIQQEAMYLLNETHPDNDK